MPVYAYRALNTQGKTIRGVLDADSPGLVRSRLRAEGLFPVEVLLAAPSRPRGKFVSRWKEVLTRSRGSLKQLVPITRQLATLISAGLPVVQALDTVQEQTGETNLRHILAGIKDQVSSGESLAEALRGQGRVFPTFYIQLVRAGEASGSLDQVLERLALNLERRLARRAKIVSALTYPAFLAVVGLGVLVFVLSFIIPTMTGLFNDLGAAVPLPTRILLGLSGFLRRYWWLLLLGLVAAALLGFRLLKNEDRYRRVEAFLFRVPLFGPLLSELYLAQALRSLALLSGGGLPLTTALEITGQGLGRSNFAAALETARELVSQGRSLTEGLAASRLFPPLVQRMVAVGEAGGVLAEMLARLAQTYEEGTDRAMTTLTSLVEPVIIVAMGLVVGFILLSVLLPIFELSGLVG
jgi:general secretion pathway protein F